MVLQFEITYRSSIRKLELGFRLFYMNVFSFMGYPNNSSPGLDVSTELAQIIRADLNNAICLEQEDDANRTGIVPAPEFPGSRRYSDGSAGRSYHRFIHNRQLLVDSVVLLCQVYYTHQRKGMSEDGDRSCYLLTTTV